MVNNGEILDDFFQFFLIEPVVENAIDEPELALQATQDQLALPILLLLHHRDRHFLQVSALGPDFSDFSLALQATFVHQVELLIVQQLLLLAWLLQESWHHLVVHLFLFPLTGFRQQTLCDHFLECVLLSTDRLE